jgi:hypothetical protein
LEYIGGGGNITIATYAHSILRLADNSNNILLGGQAEHHYILFDYLAVYGGLNNPPIESYSIGVEGVVIVSSTTSFALQHYISYNGSYGNELIYTTNAGIPMNLGPETYSRISIQKIN